MLQHVKAFRDAHGRLPRPESHDWGESSLGQWLAGQREAALRGQLPEALDAFAAQTLGHDWPRRGQDRTAESDERAKDDDPGPPRIQGELIGRR